MKSLTFFISKKLKGHKKAIGAIGVMRLPGWLRRCYATLKEDCPAVYGKGADSEKGTADLLVQRVLLGSGPIWKCSVPPAAMSS